MEHGYFDKWYSEPVELLSTSNRDLTDYHGFLKPTLRKASASRKQMP